jgi:hypothetical protein
LLLERKGIRMVSTYLMIMTLLNDLAKIAENH